MNVARYLRAMFDVEANDVETRAAGPLKPCPCCGRPAALEDMTHFDDDPSWFVSCECGMETRFGWKQTVIDLWNARP